MLLETAADLLWEEGLAVGAEHLTFTRVFDRLERAGGPRVTHASVIGRLWRNQAEFQAEVLSRLAAADQWNLQAQLHAQVSWALAGLRNVEGSSDEARLEAATRLVRVGGGAAFDSLVRSRAWPRWVGTWALAVADAGPDRRSPVLDLLVEGARPAARRSEELCRSALAELGLRVRPPFTHRHLSVVLVSFTQGGAIRDAVDGALREPVDEPAAGHRSPRSGGEAEPPTLYTFGLEGLAMAFIEPDPGWRPRTRRAVGARRAAVPGRASPIGELPPAAPGPSAPAPPALGPCARRSKDDLRELLLEAGVELLAEEGLATGAGHLTFADVFGRVEAATGARLTRSAVLGRIWPDQAAFRRDVLLHVAGRGTELLRSTAGAVPPLLAVVPGTSEAERWWTLGEICRVASSLNIERLARSRRWQRCVAVWAVATSGGDRAGQGPEDGQVTEALSRGYETAARDYEGLLCLLLSHLGLRLRPGLRMAQLTTAAASLVGGFALRRGGHDAVVSRPTGRDGEDQQWTLFAVALEALLRAFVEPDPKSGP